MLLPDLPETDSLYLDRTDSKEVVLSVTAELWVGPPTHSFVHSISVKPQLRVGSWIHRMQN